MAQQSDLHDDSNLSEFIVAYLSPSMIQYIVFDCSANTVWSYRNKSLLNQTAIMPQDGHSDPYRTMQAHTSHFTVLGKLSSSQCGGGSWSGRGLNWKGPLGPARTWLLCFRKCNSKSAGPTNTPQIEHLYQDVIQKWTLKQIFKSSANTDRYDR